MNRKKKMTERIYMNKEQVSICLDCIYCMDEITKDRKQLFYCNKNLTEIAPKTKWNCFEPLTEEDIPF